MAGLEGGPNRRIDQLPQKPEPTRYEASAEMAGALLETSDRDQKPKDVKEYLYNDNFVGELASEYSKTHQEIKDGIFKVFQIRFGTEHPHGDQKISEAEMRASLKFLLQQ